MRNIFFSTIAFCIFLNACNTGEECIESPDVSEVSVNLKVERVEQELFTANSKEETYQLLEQHSVIAERFLTSSDYTGDSALAVWLYDFIQNPYIDTLYQNTQAVFGDFSGIKEEFEQAFQYIKYYYPQYEVPVINTMITGMSADIYISDSVFIIGLDMFQGEGARYRPQTYNYMLNRYQPASIVPSCLLFLSPKWNETDPEDNTLLAEMIYYGKSLHWVKQMMPCTADSLLIGYNQEEMTLIREEEETIWKYFIDNELLYETSHIEKERYLSERPATNEIDPKVPGRIGRWVGWQIVKSFSENNPEVTLQELMKMKNTEEIFRRAKYRP
jgi:gliding motility-associated lipoprotein GldB